MNPHTIAYRAFAVLSFVSFACIPVACLAVGARGALITTGVFIATGLHAMLYHSAMQPKPAYARIARRNHRNHR